MINAVVKDIQNCESLHIVKFDFLGQTLTMMSLELPSSIGVGTKVLLQVKPSHVAIGKDTGDMLISYSNRLESKIISITSGTLLSSLKLQVANDTILESIITKDSVTRLGLKENDTVTAYIKASELSIAKVL